MTPDRVSVAYSPVTLTWNVGDPHSGGFPENLPKWRVISVSTTGKVTPLGLGQTDYDGAGFLLMDWKVLNLSSGTAYYNSGIPYTPVYNCVTPPPDLSAVVVDTSQFDYVVEIIDEWGPDNARDGNTYSSVVASFTDIADMRFQT